MITSHDQNAPQNFEPSIENPAVPCWPVLESALSQLLPPPNGLTTATSLTSDHFLKFYTLVFEHCVGAVEVKKGTTTTHGGTSGLNICGEELYLTLKTFLQFRFNQWSQYIQLDRLQSAEKPVTFIFTYLERHWIDRQINEPRVDILPMKQLLWSLWDDLVLDKIFKGPLMNEIGQILRGLREGSVVLEEMEPLARLVHYLRVISRPTQLESDFRATRRTLMAGAVVNPHASHRDRFSDFVGFYCQCLNDQCPKHDASAFSIDEFVQRALQFWNEEEGRTAFLRFDKPAQISVRNHLKSLLLLPNLEAFRKAFHAAILDWNVLGANAIYRLLANRKSLLLHLDSEAEASFLAKGKTLLQNYNDTINNNTNNTNNINNINNINNNNNNYEFFDDHFFINTLGQYYSRLGELIQTALAGRPEIFEARSKALRILLNSPPRGGKSFAPKSLARFADYIIRNFADDENDENLAVLIALFRLIDEKEEFLEGFGKHLGLRLLSGTTGHYPGPFETGLLNRLREICGSAAVKSFEKMYEDLRNQTDSSLTVLTAGAWNIRGKLLPGHVLFTATDSSLPNQFPIQIASQIAAHTRDYHAKNPKRKLILSPLLTEMEFNLVFGLKSGVSIRGNCLHFTLLQNIADGSICEHPFNSIILNSLLQSGLILKASNNDHFVLNDSFSTSSPDEVIDLYSVVLEELILSTNHSRNASSNPSSNTFINNNNSHTRPASSSVLGTPHAVSAERISPIDKSILLQCSISRILKQLRVLSLEDLFNRLSMLPKLLTRFSPSVSDLLEALKQLHEKEFVRLAVGTGVDDLIDIGCGEGNGPILGLDSIETYTDKLFIKYLA